MPKPYQVETDHKGCKRCDAGHTWFVVDPDGVAGSVSYDDKEQAEYDADLQNDAYAKGYKAGLKKVEKKKIKNKK